jgi:SpoIID/LytB domain protein
VTARSRAAFSAALSLVALSAPPVLAAPAGAVFVLDGKGYGHGVGMAQDSANAMAAAGMDHEQILQHFYPGTKRGRRSSVIRVAVWEAGAPSGEVLVTVPQGARVGDDSSAVQARPGAVLRVVADGAGYHVREVVQPQGAAVRGALLASPSPSPTDGPLPPVLSSPSPAGASASPSPAAESPAASSAPRPSAPGRSAAPASPSPAPTGTAPLTYDSTSPVTITPAGGGTARVGATGRSYRGALLALSRSGFRLVDVLDIEDYLRGLGEVPSSWPAAALRTQAVAARTYALRAVGAGHPLGYDVCDDTRCQVFLGVQADNPRSAAAAAYTRGEVVTYRGSLADTFYSANAGGLTATPGEGFGGTSTIPYLPGGVQAPGGVAPWKVTAAPADIAARLGYAGRLDAITVIGTGPSGRVTRLRLEGAAGPVELSGVDAQRRLGLRSTLFTVTRGTGTAQPLPAPATAQVQLAPGEAAAVTAEPSPAPVPEPEVAAPARAAAVADRLPVPLVGTAGVLVGVAGLGVALAARARRQQPHVQGPV